MFEAKTKKGWYFIMKKCFSVILGVVTLSVTILSFASASFSYRANITSSNSAYSSITNDNSASRYCENYILKTDDPYVNIANLVTSFNGSVAPHNTNTIYANPSLYDRLVSRAIGFKGGAYYSGTEQSFRKVLK